MKSLNYMPQRWLSPILVVSLVLSAMLAPPAQAAEEESVEEAGPSSAIYIKFHPDFIVNLKDKTSSFLMVTVQGMSREQRGINLARQHMAAIRHQLLMLLSEQTTESVRSLEGKRALQEAALLKIQDVMTKETGEPRIEAVLFTDFVLE